MNYLSFKTTHYNKSSIKKKWYIIDATGKKLGRLSSNIIKLITGKNKIFYSPHINFGDYVIIINASKIELSGKKWEYKTYIHYTGYPGGQKKIKIKELFNKNPKLIIEKAIKRMLPKNRLKNKFFKNLFIYNDNYHKHNAQNPKIINTY